MIAWSEKDLSAKIKETSTSQLSVNHNETMEEPTKSQMTIQKFNSSLIPNSKALQFRNLKKDARKTQQASKIQMLNTMMQNSSFDESKNVSEIHYNTSEAK
jgi:hypothetical protein